MGPEKPGASHKLRVEDIWYRNSPITVFLRALLLPFSWIYRIVAGIRNYGYDLALLRVEDSPVRTISVGNISVGGTGKTPVSAYFARQLRERGYRPAIVMRGYGGDEPLVHRHLSPDVPVFTDADRVRGIQTAISEGADSVVLDDAFQHRRAGRTLDIVLVSADHWFGSRFPALLPAGPLREPPAALKRASLVIITNKSASDVALERARLAVQSVAPGVPVVYGELMPKELLRLDLEESLPLSALEGASVLAIAGIGNPVSFFRQLEAQGAKVTEVVFPDHHAYTAEDVKKLIERAESHKHVVTTLKDAVKLSILWPAKGAVLWYVSQAVQFDEKKAEIDTVLSNTFPFIG